MLVKDIKVIALMGVSGCGKTTVGHLLADQLGWEYLESDEYHSQKDIGKMSAGIPLTDDDRWPWLRTLNQLLKRAHFHGRKIVLGCSALKGTYRELFAEGVDGLVFIHLKGSYQLIHDRMQQRQHFMGAAMLQSQFDILEETPDLLAVDIKPTPPQIVKRILSHLARENSRIH